MPCTGGSVLSRIGLLPLKSSQTSEGDIYLNPNTDTEQSNMKKYSGISEEKEGLLVSSQRRKGN